MAVASWRPALWVNCAFNAQPNDPAEIPAWSDLSSPFFIAADGITRGRQYELDQVQANQPSFTFLDQSEYLNPANTASPYYPGVVPMRELLFQAMWPNQSSGNLLNANQGASSILGTTTAGYDPSFDSYTAGATVPWITALGGTAPVVGTTTPHSSPNDLTWAVATGSTTEQGASWVVPCVPGQQYTESAYVRQSTASTQVIGVAGLTSAQDAFNRTSSNGWGTATIGGSWTTAGGSASDYSVTPGAANILGASVSVTRTVVTGTAAQDCDVIGFVQVDQVATGAAIRAAVIGRQTGATTFYAAMALFNTDQSITFSLRRNVAGTETSITSTTMSFPYAIDTLYGLRLTVTGGVLSGSMWEAVDIPPTVATLSTTDTNITGTGTVGCYQRLSAGNTNSSPNTTFSTFSARYTLAGTSTTTTGSYVRLTCTFTASQPTHTIQVAALSATAGTVLLDDVQHEQGASAGTFTTTGPTIYGVFRGFVERWPSEWTNAGFLGYCQATAVDAFEPLNRYTLNSEYESAVLATSPDFYWPLNDASGSTVYGEQSGNNESALFNFSSSVGPGTLPAAGEPMDINGDPSGTGVTITPGGSSITNQAGTVPGAGFLPTLPSIAFPTNVAGSWGASVASWVQATPNATSDQGIFQPDAPNTSVAIGAIETIIAGISHHFNVLAGGTSSFLDSGGGPDVLDGVPHLLIGTVTQVVGGNTTATTYVDGVQVDTQTVTTASLGGPVPGLSTALAVGGRFRRLSSAGPLYYDMLNGTIAHVALWNRALSAAEVTALWDAGGLGNAGETSGTRIARYVSSAWTESTAIDTGSSIMGIATVTTGTPVLAACQDVNTTEQGNFWANKDGQVAFAGRQSRYLTTTSRYTFGELESGGEYPYEEALEYDFDPTFVYNQVTVNNADGVTATVSNSASQHEYFPRANTTDANLQSDNDAIQLGYWLLNNHAQPTQRIQSITLDPMGNPTLWPVILGLKIGDRVTVKRRPKAANGGTGFTMSGDFFVENISHGGIDMSVQNATWKTTLLLSPANETSGVFIFNDATYGVFDAPLARFAY